MECIVILDDDNAKSVTFWLVDFVKSVIIVL